MSSKMDPIEINSISDFEKAQKYVLEILRIKKIPKQLITDTMLVFEALFHEIFSRKKDAGAAVTIQGEERLGCVSIRFNFEGGMHVPENGESLLDSPEEKILQAFSDKIDYSYQLGITRIRITIRNSHMKAMFPCGAAVFTGIALFFLLHFFGNEGVKRYMLSNFILPSETLFGNAMLMVGAPVTFLSLLKNMTNNYIVSERSNYVRMLRRRIVLSSTISVSLAVVAALLTAGIVSQAVSFTASTTMRVDITIPDFIVSLLPSDIFAPFQMISPFPLIIVAMIVFYAMCSVGVHFDSLIKALDAAYELFSRILTITMAALPIAAFLATQHILLMDGTSAVLYAAQLTLAVVLSLAVFMSAFYWIRLKKSGIGVIQFVKNLKPLLKENYMIGSIIDAAPFNIRYCARVFHMDRKKMMFAIPVLSQINLDGNCFIITYISLVLMLTSSTKVGWVNIALIALLVFFLSLGAPNQPGSCLIGILIILTYMGASELIPLAILSEVVYGSLLNLTNVTGVIVTAAEFERKMLK